MKTSNQKNNLKNESETSSVLPFDSDMSDTSELNIDNKKVKIPIKEYNSIMEQEKLNNEENEEKDEEEDEEDEEKDKKEDEEKNKYKFD